MKNFKRLTIFSVTVVTLLIGFCLYYFKIHTDDYFNKEASYYLVNEDHVGTGGYDVTSYFTDGKAIEGDTTNAYEYDGVTYFFASEHNKSLFISNPEKYLPQYGGYCAFGLGIEVGEGVGNNKPGKYPSTPTSFKIIDNKLYLFHDSEFFRAKDAWEQDESRYLRQSRKVWEAIHPEQKNQK